METLATILAMMAILGGLFFFLVGTVGLIRLPDAFTRMHATTKADTLGAGLILLGLMIYIGFELTSVKLLIIIIFIWVTNPTSAHIIAKATAIAQKISLKKETHGDS